jgi:hypothetical protein
MRMKAWIGKSLFIIGAGHSLVGFIVFRSTIALMIKEDLVNTIPLNGNSSKEAAFWFLFTGFALMIIGGLVNLIENKNINMPAFLLWSLILMTAIGVFMMPVSGFWLLLIPILGLLLRQRNNR